MGTLPPVALIHGFGSSFEHGWARHSWPDLLADAGRTVVAVDLLGHGESARPHEVEPYHDLSAHTLAQLPDEPVDVIAFSAGAITTLRMAVEAPGRFRRLVLMGVGDHIFTESNSRGLITALEDPDGPPPDDLFMLLLRRMADSPRNDRQALLAFSQRRVAAVTEAELGQLTLPVLLIVGESESANPPTRLAQALPDQRLIVIPGRDHFSVPSDFATIEAALEFVSH